jgi:hypothetical protein
VLLQQDDIDDRLVGLVRIGAPSVLVPPAAVQAAFSNCVQIVRPGGAARASLMALAAESRSCGQSSVSAHGNGRAACAGSRRWRCARYGGVACCSRSSSGTPSAKDGADGRFVLRLTLMRTAPSSFSVGRQDLRQVQACERRPVAGCRRSARCASGRNCPPRCMISAPACFQDGASPCRLSMAAETSRVLDGEGAAEAAAAVDVGQVDQLDAAHFS